MPCERLNGGVPTEFAGLRLRRFALKTEMTADRPKHLRNFGEFLLRK